MSQRGAATAYGVGIATVVNWLRVWRESGTVSARPMGGDRNARDRLKGHPWYGACEAFCSRWDQVSFDPDYPTKPLEVFEPAVRRIFSREAHDPRYRPDSR